MAIALTKETLTKLANGFGISSDQYNAIVAAAIKSDFFAAELNAFGKLEG